jgi:CRP/FNR family transcriptional regulator
MVPAGCQVCGARKFGICRALKASELLRLSASTRRRKINHGDIITFEEDEVVDYANIVEGAVKLTKILKDGRQQIVGLQFAPGVYRQTVFRAGYGNSRSSNRRRGLRVSEGRV